MGVNPALLELVSKGKNKYAGSTGKALKPKEGLNTYRIIAPTFDVAPWVGAGGQFWADLGVHWIKADENGKPIAVVGDCDTVYQQPSVLNSAIDMAISSAIDEQSKKLYESWRARKTVLINVIDRDDKSNPNPQVLELTTTTFHKVLELIQLYAQNDQDITDPVKGVDIVIRRSGKGLNTEYQVMVSPGISQPVPAEVVAKAVDLQAYIETNYFKGDEQKALNAITQIAGIALPRLGQAAATSGALGRSPTPALSSPSAVVEGAVVAPTPTPAAAPAAPQPTPEEQKRAALLAQQRKLQEELAAIEAATSTPVVARPAAAPAAAPAPAADVVQGLSAADQDQLLAELDQLLPK